MTSVLANFSDRLDFLWHRLHIFGSRDRTIMVKCVNSHWLLFAKFKVPVF